MKITVKHALRGAAAAVLVAGAIAAVPVQARTFHWAFQGDAQSLDPDALNETFTLLSLT